MNQNHIADLSAELIMKYYDNDYMPFLLHMDDDALWYGPAEGQFLRGRDEMIRVWTSEKHDLLFTMGNLNTHTASAHPSFCDVMLTYTVVTHYPDGHDLSLFQRLQLTWCERTKTGEDGKKIKEARILVCHISNPHLKHDEDIIYPVRSQQVFSGQKLPTFHGERIHFHGIDHTDYFYLSDTVIWIEAASGGKHSILHTADTQVEVMASIAALEKQYPRLFLRCHQSYLINPHYVRSLRRFRLTLTNGTQLPVPEKKYTAFRDKLMKSLKG